MGSTWHWPPKGTHSQRCARRLRAGTVSARAPPRTSACQRRQAAHPRARIHAHSSWLFLPPGTCHAVRTHTHTGWAPSLRGRGCARVALAKPRAAQLRLRAWGAWVSHRPARTPRRPAWARTRRWGGESSCCGLGGGFWRWAGLSPSATSYSIATKPNRDKQWQQWHNTHARTRKHATHARANTDHGPRTDCMNASLHSCNLFGPPNIELNPCQTHTRDAKISNASKIQPSTPSPPNECQSNTPRARAR